ncbi:LacI family transcriptional regulator [Prauserella marina]|uniref:DNA-binding transcriptional regulator, LacI/PurR family n=1 Tax=Prauserella marina TaxID=530584 RepID=A0A222VRK8_9PSEU|nr:LacI family DNA-binding transcriptional regulator [Prauserella marina]ASR36482.1 LacI family transcriptional regulator [Prauserella marina]PWV73854.1 LacI family transcriptional regulator [Prauserella marina]SDD57530.1 DNA-binding transcriptional regulator, LacI/PurR family [Prauserella marina]
MIEPGDAAVEDRGTPTLEEVARVAGVSRSTVSRVINDLPGVSARARESVNEAIQLLGYVPNEAARSLVTRRTNSIALVVSEPGDRVFSDPFFAGVLRGIHSGLAGSHRQLVLMLMAEDDDGEQLEKYLSSGHVDGALVVSMHGDDTLPQRLAEGGLPVVAGGRPLSGTDVPYVDSDNFTGGLLAARHLVERGKTRIASIAGPADMAVGIDRLVGWRRGMSEARLATDAVVHSDFSVEGGARAMAELLDRHPGVDAVFAAADIVAVGAVRELSARGKRIPGDVAVVGFDDSVLATSVTPQLTTVRQTVEEFGRTMTWRLLAQLAGEEHLPPSILLPTELVVRQSS